jgi:hypothetical protein
MWGTGDTSFQDYRLLQPAPRPLLCIFGLQGLTGLTKGDAFCRPIVCFARGFDVRGEVSLKVEP